MDNDTPLPPSQTPWIDQPAIPLGAPASPHSPLPAQNPTAAPTPSGYPYPPPNAQPPSYQPGWAPEYAGAPPVAPGYPTTPLGAPGYPPPIAPPPPSIYPQYPAPVQSYTHYTGPMVGVPSTSVPPGVYPPNYQGPIYIQPPRPAPTFHASGGMQGKVEVNVGDLSKVGTAINNSLEGTSKWAIASLVCIILTTFTGVTVLLAIVFGHVALNEIKQHPGMKGRTMALVSVIIGYCIVGFAVLTFIVVTVLDIVITVLTSPQVQPTPAGWLGLLIH